MSFKDYTKILIVLLASYSVALSLFLIAEEVYGLIFPDNAPLYCPPTDFYGNFFISRFSSFFLFLFSIPLFLELFRRGNKSALFIFLVFLITSIIALVFSYVFGGTELLTFSAINVVPIQFATCLIYWRLIILTPRLYDKT